MRRVFALSVAVLGVALWTAAPAQAIETRTFGMEPQHEAGSEGQRTSYRIELRAGEPAAEALRIWNKTEQPMSLKMSAVAASLDERGKVTLGGASGVASWFAFDPQTLQLAPKESRIVHFEVRAPRTLESGDVAAAVVVEPVRGSGGGVAVVERLATMVYVSAVAGSAGIGWKIPALVVLSLITIAGAVATWTRPQKTTAPVREPKQKDVTVDEAEPADEAPVARSADESPTVTPDIDRHSEEFAWASRR